MARTNWGPIILGMGLLGGGIYIFLRWEDVCPTIMGAENCITGNLVGDVRARIDEYNSRPSCSDPNNRTSNCRVGSYTKVPQAALNKQLESQRDFSPGSANTKAAQTQLRQMGYLNSQNKPAVPPGSSALARADAVCAGKYCATYPTSSACKCCAGKRYSRAGKLNVKPGCTYFGSLYTQQDSYYTAGHFNSFNTFTLNRMSVR